MATVDYPEALPAPQSAPFQPHERRQLTTMPGPRDSRALSRDRLANQQCSFKFTLAQAELFNAWWKDTLIEGGAWFASDWPHPQGVTAGRKFIGVPKWGDYVPGELWPVTADFEVRGRGELPAEPPVPCGVLCHFNQMDGSEVLSAIGPNFVPTGAAALDFNTNRPPKFGPASGDCDANDFVATGITCTNDSNWRAEGWFWHDTSQGACFTLGDDFDFPGVKIYKAAVNMTSVVRSSLGFGSQVLSGFIPTPSTWFHVAVQYVCDVGDPDYHRLYWFANGARQGEMVGGGPTDYFANSVFGEVKVAGYGVDEFFLRYHVPNAQLYRSSYTVPTAPFAPADPL